MKSGGRFEQCYNAQAVVEVESRLIVGERVSQSPNASITSERCSKRSESTAGAVSQDKKSPKTKDLIGGRWKIRKRPASDDPLQNGAAILFSSVEDEVRHAARKCKKSVIFLSLDCVMGAAMFAGLGSHRSRAECNPTLQRAVATILSSDYARRMF
jgi:hypothetical protein